MKEMLNNLADGQIELYRSVSGIFSSSPRPLYLFILGYGGMG